MHHSHDLGWELAIGSSYFDRLEAMLEHLNSSFRYGQSSNGLVKHCSLLVPVVTDTRVIPVDAALYLTVRRK